MIYLGADGGIPGNAGECQGGVRGWGRSMGCIREAGFSRPIFVIIPISLIYLIGYLRIVLRSHYNNQQNLQVSFEGLENQYLFSKMTIKFHQKKLL